jgi:hypothetical protein
MLPAVIVERRDVIARLHAQYFTEVIQLLAVECADLTGYFISRQKKSSHELSAFAP